MHENSLQWLGHNAWLLRYAGVRILVDPYLTDNPKAAVTAEEVEAEYVLVSHGHGDHLGDTVPIAKRTGAAVLAIAEIGSWLKEQGVKNVISMNIGGGVKLPFGRVEMVPATHSSTLPDGTPGGNSCGFLVTFSGGEVFYFACDTGIFLDMQLLAKRHVHTAILPIGDLFTMGPAESLEAIRMIRPKYVLPCHYNTWRAITQDVEKWREMVARETDVTPVVLVPGEKYGF